MLNLKTILLGVGIFYLLTKALEDSGSIPEGGSMPATIYDKWASAIMEFEGWFPGSVSWRNNNPGNLKAAGQPGIVTKDSQGHAIFDSFQNGWRALVNQLRAAVEGRSAVYTPSMTIEQFFSRYAEANSKEYAAFVSARLGVSPQTQIRELIGV